jgi:hypothetical protein
MCIHQSPFLLVNLFAFEKKGRSLMRVDIVRLENIGIPRHESVCTSISSGIWPKTSWSKKSFFLHKGGSRICSCLTWWKTARKTLHNLLKRELFLQIKKGFEIVHWKISSACNTTQRVLHKNLQYWKRAFYVCLYQE